MRQMLLRFTPASGKPPLFATQWRDAVAAQLNMAGRNATDDAFRLFHHAQDICPDPSRGPSEKAGVCFLGSPTWIGVLATGPDNIDLVRRHTMEIILAANASHGPCAVEHHDHQLGYESTSRVYDYVMHQHVSRSDHKQPHTTAWLHARVVKALNDWALQFDLEPDFTTGDVLITGFERRSPYTKRNRDGTLWTRHRSRVTFSMPFKLKGLWAAGALASKGYSFVQFDRPEEAREAA